MKNSSKYQPLAADDDEEATPLNTLGGPLEDDECGSSGRADSLVLGRLLTAAVALLLVCSMLSLVFLVLNAQTQWALHSLLGGTNSPPDLHYERPDPGLLERPSTYVGLDKLPAELLHSALPDALDVFPPFFQPVDHIHRNYVFPADGHARFTFNGRVAPGDHRVLLTDHITMVAQFRVHDYGMEHCRIVSSIPSWSLLQSRNQTLHLAGDTSRIEVWNLTTTPVELDERTLSWASKPPRLGLITTLSLDENSTHASDGFWCGPSGSLQTIELLCTGVGCYIEMWQDIYFQPRFGIYIQQSPSV